MVFSKVCSIHMCAYKSACVIIMMKLDPRTVFWRALEGEGLPTQSMRIKNSLSEERPNRRGLPEGGLMERA